MTVAPTCLIDVRNLLLGKLNIHPSKESADLESDEVGIVGDPNHRGGYHCGSDRVVKNDYSVIESSRDRNGLNGNAAALDVGLFRYKTYDLPHFSKWMVHQCEIDAPDARDIREIIYSPDGKRVVRWDRLGRRDTGDKSHLIHTHFSFFRDAMKAGRDQRPLFQRYLQTIGLLAGEDDDMTPAQDARLERIEKMLSQLDGRTAQGTSYLRLSGAPEVDGATGDRNGYSLTEAHEKLDALTARPAPGTVVIDKDDLKQALRELLRDGIAD